MTIDQPTDPIAAWLAEHGEELIALRRQIHAHPELSWHEHATTDLVAERLALAGLSPVRLSSGTGLVCDLFGDHVSGPIFAWRADLDALAMDDEKQVPYRSQVDGVAHACGHDVHTTIALGAALYLAHHLEDLPGRLRFVFQPAEEQVPGGALDVLADGGLEGVDAIVGFHCDPKLDVGLVGLKEGPISSAADMVRISLRGPGGHTARPELTVDMVPLAAKVIAELPRNVGEATGDPSQVKFVFGAVHAGDAANVIPSHCDLAASIRTPLPSVWRDLPGIVEQELAALLRGTGAEYELEYTSGVPPVVNDPATTDTVTRAAERTLGAASIQPAVQSWGGDDFAWFVHEVPGTYVRLGVHDPASKGPRLDLHAGHFDVDERCISAGIRLAIEIMREYFAEAEASAARA
jgi:amidohydrolase